MSHHDDFATEPVPGLPANLPEGEEIKWQGKPETAAIAASALHTRKIALYFAALAAWRLGSGLYDSRPAAEIVSSVVWTGIMAAAALGILYFIAHLMHRTTIYTITNRRVVMRIGIALPITFNLPFSQITAADAKQLTKGTGDIALSLAEHTKISWAVLWPHTRPWKLAKPQPALRAIPDVDGVAALLAQQLRTTHTQAISQPSGIATPNPASSARMATHTGNTIGGLQTRNA